MRGNNAPGNAGGNCSADAGVWWQYQGSALSFLPAR
jgi:hypothetical protein